MAADSASWTDPRLATTRFGDIRWFDELDSTNRYVMGQARAGAAEGLVAVADFQTQGRGRLDRIWEASPKSSLLVSVLVRPSLPPDRLHLVAHAAAVAMAAAAETASGLSVGLKWPNDLLVGDRKLGGMLAEVDPGPAVVIGMGVNVSADAFSDELAPSATAIEIEAGRTVDRGEVLVQFLRALDALLDAPDIVEREYRRRLLTLGQRVRVELPAGAITGMAVDVDHFGHLLVETAPGCIEEIAAGDVVHLRADSS